MLYLVLALVLTAMPASAAQRQQGDTVPGPETAAPAAPATQEAPARVSGDTVVAPLDVLKITVYGETDLSGPYRVDPEGSFNYPFLNRIQAAGRKVKEIEDELIKKLSDGYVRRPQVSIEVESGRAKNWVIVGEVRTPGKHPLATNQTLIEGLAQAGYVTAAAGSTVQINRVDRDDPTKGTTIEVSLADLLGGKPEANVPLQENDMVIVLKASKFYIVGQVKSPGPFTLERGMTVRQALALAGGVTDKGSDRRLKAERMVNGVKKQVDIKLTDPVLAEDTIIVPQRLL
jgi:polysaccharide biosynthesis/export protein